MFLGNKEKFRRTLSGKKFIRETSKCFDRNIFWQWHSTKNLRRTESQ